MIAVGITTITVLHITFSSSIDNVRKTTANEGSFFVSSVQNEISQKKLLDRIALLSKDETDKIIAERSSHYSEYGSIYALAIYSQNGDMTGCGGEFYNIKTELLPSFNELEKDKFTTHIYEYDSLTYIVSASVFQAEENSYALYTLHDISNIFNEYTSLFKTAGYVSIIFAVLISLILLCFLIFLLSPLSKLKNTVSKIAEGDYSARVKVKGSAEIREISEKINIMAEAVEENAKKLEDIAEGRKQYVNNLAHEMKTPLTSILCYGDILRIKKDVKDEERLEYSRIIVDEAKRLKNMSSKLLQLATADSAELDYNVYSVSDILSEVKNTMEPSLEKMKLKLTYEGEDGEIFCDRELFKSLIYNLFDNAAKASFEGGTVRLKSRCEKNGIVISVQDNGIGMTKDVLKKITEPFYMADKSRSRSAGGAGLGLSLCLEIAKRHYARLTAKSRSGAGTTMFITVPYAEGGRRLIENKD